MRTCHYSFRTLCYHGAGFGYEDADAEYTYTVIGGAGLGSPDKYFTQSGRGTTIIQDFCADGKFGKLLCSCGDCRDQVTRRFEVSNVKMRGPGLSIVSLLENYGDTATLSGIQLFDQDRPSTRIEYICQSYKDNSDRPSESYSPDEDGKRQCGYSTSDLTLETAGAQQQVPSMGTPAAQQNPPATVRPPNIDPNTGLPVGQPTAIDPNTGLPVGQPTAIDPNTGLPYGQTDPWQQPYTRQRYPSYFPFLSSSTRSIPSNPLSSSFAGASTFYVCLLISLFVPQIPRTLLIHHNNQFVEIDSKYLTCDPSTNESEDKEEENDEEDGYHCKFIVRLEEEEENKCAKGSILAQLKEAKKSQKRAYEPRKMNESDVTPLVKL